MQKHGIKFIDEGIASSITNSEDGKQKNVQYSHSKTGEVLGEINTNFNNSV